MIDYNEEQEERENPSDCQEDKTTHSGEKKKGDTRLMLRIAKWFFFILVLLLIAIYICFFLWSAIGGASAPKGVHYFFPWLPTE